MKPTTIVLCLLAALTIVPIFLYGVEKQEKVECLKWKEQAQEYPRFFLTQSQAEQCERHDVQVGAIVL